MPNHGSCCSIDIDAAREKLRTSGELEKAAVFLSDPKNLAEMDQGLKDAQELNRRMNEARAVTWEMLHRPMTI